MDELFCRVIKETRSSLRDVKVNGAEQPTNTQLNNLNKLSGEEETVRSTLRSLGVLNNDGFTRSYKCSREAALITHWSTTPPLVLVVGCFQMISFHSLMLLTFLNETSTEHLS